MPVEMMNAAPTSPRVTVDNEANLRARIESAIRMGIALHQQQRVWADKPAIAGGVRGIAEGTAIEIIQMLGLEPSYVNLRRMDEESLLIGLSNKGGDCP